MKAPVAISVVFCTVAFIGSLGLLARTSYHLWNDHGSGNIPIEQSREWMTHVTCIIPLCLGFVLLCVFTLWTVLMNNRIKCFIAVLILNFLCLAATVYFAVVFFNELDGPNASGELLFSSTKTAINNSNKTHWLPVWLDRIQYKSSECCGILTFRDWEEFWPQSKSEIPKSCCKDPENKTMYCPADLSRIPYPGTPSMFMKTDTGCLDEINDLMKKNTRECFIYILLICWVFGCAEIAYFFQFYKQYIPRSRSPLDRYSSRGDKFFDDKGGPQGDDGLNLPNTETDSYLQLSGFTASLQTANSGSFQISGNASETGNQPMALSSITSSAGLGGEQQSLTRMSFQQEQGQWPDQSQIGRPGFNGPTGSNADPVGMFKSKNTNDHENSKMYEDSQNQEEMPSLLKVAASSSDVDRFDQKKRNHRHGNDIGTDSNPKDGTRVEQQEVFIAPDTIDDFCQGPSVVSNSSNDVGDKLTDVARSSKTGNKKKKFWFRMNSKRQ